MKKLYSKTFRYILILLFLQIICISNNVNGQTIYKGDAVKLSITNNYRGTIQWQESVNGTTWTDIKDGATNNLSVKPLVSTRYRAMVTEDKCDPVYTAVKSITISTDIGLLVNVPVVTSVTANVANLDGQITRLGGEVKVTERGICWSKLNNPTINDSKTSDGTDTGTFKSIISGLTENTVYNARAYAVTDGGQVLYSNQISITTLPAFTVSFVGAYDITATTATSGGLITINGTETITERGVCWSINTNPTIANSKSSNGTSDGTYSSSLTNLLPEKMYYLRAYVTSSSEKTYYSLQTTFETLSTYVFTVQTTNTATITGTSAISGGTIAMTGTGAVAARGVCWSTSPLPTVENSKTSNGTGVGSFSSSITGLIPATTYYVRAYATSATGKTTYGNQNEFSTNSPFTITTTIASAITAGTANSGGNITITTPGASILSRGVCYGLDPNPTIDGSRTEDGTTAGTFISSLSELKANTKYYIRAYATDANNKTSYGNELSFFTDLPLTVTITTTNPTNITLFSADSGGSITTSGPGSITAKGVCISTEPLPNLENNKTVDGTGTATYKSSLSNLVAGEKFYVRAYATSNSGITTYGNEVIFNSLAPITAITKSVGGISTVGASVEGSTTIIDKNRSIKARGFCWSTSTNPTIANTKSSENVLTDGAFSSTMIGLSANTTYYVRAYAISESDVVYYGNQISFQTMMPFLSNIVLNAATAITRNSASISGTYSSSGTGRVYGIGIAYGTSPNPTYDPKSANLNFGATFNYNFSNLTAGVTYYARAYAITDTGLQYGNSVSFKTTGYLATVTTQPVSELTSVSARLSMSWNVPADEQRTSSSILISDKPNVTTSNSGTLSIFKPGSAQSSGNNYSMIMEGFVANTTYYVRSYIKMSDNTEIYGNEISFKTPVAPVGTLKVNTVTSTSILSTSVSLIGNYSSVGGMNRIGFCLSTNTTPTIADQLSTGATTNNISIIDGAQYPNFSAFFGNLLPLTKYYYRALAIDYNGALVYGEVLSFTTLAPDQSRTFNVSTPAPTNVESSTATLGWTVFSPNVPAADYQRGVCYSLKPNPTMQDFGAGAPPTFPVTSWPVTNLIPNSTYYIRAFAYDPLTKIAYYGNELTFNTKYAKLINLVLIDPPSEITNTSVKLNMNVYAEESYLGGGFCYSTTPGPTVNSTKATNVVPVQYYTDAMSYISTTTGLAVNTTYYVRGYSKRLLEDSYVYSNEVVFKTASLKVETYNNGPNGGLNYTTSNRIINYGTETVVQRGLVYAVVSDEFPTLATGYYTFEGTGTADFTAKVALPAYSTRYYIRAYAKTDSGQIIYGNVIDYTTGANPNPPTTTPPVCNGCSDPGVGTPPVVVKGPGYLVFGRVIGPATLDCREGSAIFSDYKAFSTSFVQGEFTNASSSKVREEMIAHLKNKFPGEKYEYFVEFSYNYSPIAKYAVIIEYKKKIPGWDCYSTLVTIGYGTTKAEALAKAVERKNNDINGAKNATYKELKTVTW